MRYKDEIHSCVHFHIWMVVSLLDIGWLCRRMSLVI